MFCLTEKPLQLGTRTARSVGKKTGICNCEDPLPFRRTRNFLKDGFMRRSELLKDSPGHFQSLIKGRSPPSPELLAASMRERPRR